MRWEVLLKQNIVIAITIKQINRIEVLTIGATVFIFQELISINNKLFRKHYYYFLIHSP